MADLKIEIEELEKAIRNAVKDSSKESFEKLNIVSTKQYSYYYLKNLKTKEKHRSTVEDPKVVKSAQADYAKAFLKQARKILAKMKEIMNFNYRKDLCSVFEQLHPARKTIVSPYILTPEQYAEQWQNQSWNDSNTYEIKSDLKTMKGEKVRSKSEQIIANLLYHAEIPYLYEKPLTLPNGKTRFPDFTILNTRTGKEYILEHFGKMDDPEYRAKAWKKIEDYSKAGYVLGDNFLFTFEETEMPLNVTILNSYIKSVFV